MPVDRYKLNDALSSALVTVGFTRISDEDQNDLTHTVADFLDDVEAGND